MLKYFVNCTTEYIIFLYLALGASFKKKTVHTCIGECPRLLVSHALTVLSIDPDKMTLDSSLNLTQLTVPLQQKKSMTI